MMMKNTSFCVCRSQNAFI